MTEDLEMKGNTKAGRGHLQLATTVHTSCQPQSCTAGFPVLNVQYPAHYHHINSLTTQIYTHTASLAKAISTGAYINSTLFNA